MYLHYAVFLPVHWHPQRRTEKMKRLTLAIAFACVLTGVARAGEIHTTRVAPPPTPNTVTPAGEIAGTDATAPQESTAILTIVLTLFSIVP